MNVLQAIRKAERVLPGEEAAEGEPDPRWQAIIAVAAHIKEHPEEVWRFARKWGTHRNADLRSAVATCLLEHLLEYHFDRVFPLVSRACRQSSRFADTLSMCSEFGQTSRPGNLERFRRLKQEVCGPLADQPRRPALGKRISSAGKSSAGGGCTQA